MVEVDPSLPETARERLFRRHDEMTKLAKALMRKKNGSYASDTDPYKNFRRHGLKGMVVRMDDKMSRLDNFLDTGIDTVEGEDISNTLLDLMNYCVLFAGYLAEEK